MAWTANDYLMHHGILGMRWGKKNGPPYPLDPSDHSASERKAGWRKSLDKGSGDEETGKKRRSLTDKQKKALKIGAGIAVSGLAVYGAYKLGKLPELDKLTSMGKNVVDSLDLEKKVRDLSKKAGDSGALNDVADRSDASPVTNPETVGSLFNVQKAKSISTITGFPVKEKPDSLEENVNKSNADRTEPDFNTKYNCAHSVVSWVLNEIGLNVKAKEMYGEFVDSGMTPMEFKRYFKNIDWNIPQGEHFTMLVNRSNSMEECKKQITEKILQLSNGENSAGVWRARAGYGHYMGWKVENGTVTFVDPQPGRFNCERWFTGLSMGKVEAGIDIARLDNLEINERYIHKAVQSA